ncbi:trehalase precursor [Oryctolagus cuniculus]|uniref:Trehalase n=1 Tax=Oryctolagus cuniculus TaxID=9986 RepID=TREA_RABIT|nr:trehalase precursor [Oryctolagus cuniculus]P19813.1 RecName: Full=Trehalase; AltName: Full=Alpha,alpha-trehalase; AltName: Full=Alpha,alpha-trehalose glucohydrolase; Flags: Precursor [Oryctolagus cuniculus]AAA63460.1 alpha,alpha-trehalose glucohydrolase [Oryctolagus cuniculus]
MPGSTWELHLLLLLGLGLGSEQALPPPCESQIYCHGELLHQVQMARLYPDDKQFVDMPLSTAPDQVLQSFAELAATYNNTVPREQLEKFVQEHFQAVGQELESWTPGDWKESPQFLQKISDPKLRAWAEQLHLLWKKLGKKIKPEVLSQPERFSLIYSQHPFIVPGGRFVEFYYWDSYWVMEGLLLSEMAETVKGMLQNFLDLVTAYGHIPNGGRVYYLQRSQPPLLTLMMDRYVAHTGDLAFLRENIETLALELDFWAENRTISVSSGGNSHTLNRYHVPYGGPRPESYSKDTELAHTLPEGSWETLWAELKAGAESGWDFSSRWLVGSPNPDSLGSIRTSKLVPVDLNAFLCQAEELLSGFYSRLGNESQATKYRNLRAQRIAALTALLWDEDKGAWFDYDLENQKKNHEFYPSNLTPLWAGCFSDPAIADKALQYLQDSQILNHRHGIPTSLQNTGQQWDFPNAWAPLQDLVIRGLAKSPSARTQEVAFQLAQNWIRTNFDVYSQRSAMYEKYDISNAQPGGGGEYEVQEGFGWTNGVALMLLDRYGDRLSSGTQLALLEPHCLAAALLLSFLTR